MVLDDPRGLLQLCDRYRDEAPGRKILLHGDTPTVFPAYDAARGAVRVTRTWARRRVVGPRDYGTFFRIIRVEVLP
jgi:hypothetical protein